MAPNVLLARVLDNRAGGASANRAAKHPLGEARPSGDTRFGVTFEKKDVNVLHIGFQNIGGMSFNSNSLKDDIVRCRISQWEFDVFGLAETNVDWRLIPEEHRPYLCTYTHNQATPPIKCQKFGGTSLLSLNKSSHRVISKGSDPSRLDCWT